jgi:RNA-directed DNA polymerase
MAIDGLNPTLRGCFGYCQHSRERTFGTLDGWIRRRRRSLLRKQQKLRGFADTTGADQTRWPNRFFANHGLFSSQAAHDTVRQPPRG